jgi:hypothetical protein
MKGKNENCRTLYTETEVFTDEQRMENRGPKLIARIRAENHRVFTRIISASNNLDLILEWRGNSETAEKKWSHEMALLNKKLIELGVIIPDEEDNRV